MFFVEAIPPITLSLIGATRAGQGYMALALNHQMETCSLLVGGNTDRERRRKIGAKIQRTLQVYGIQNIT